MRRQAVLFTFEQVLSLRTALTPCGPQETAHAIKTSFQRRRAKKQASELRAGNVVESGGMVCSVTKVDYTQGSGRQLGNVHLELRDLKAGRKTQERKRPYDMVEVLWLDSVTHQYLYEEGEQLIFIHPATFEQLAVSPHVLRAQQPFLKEGSEVTLNLLNGDVISGELPSTVTLVVLEAEPYVQGDSASAGSKGAILETGIQIAVPPYVQPGDAVVVNPVDRTFVRRVN